MMNDTIKSLAAKLAAMAAPGSGATDGERENALRKLERLLERHGLTLDDLTNEAKHTLWVKVANKGERELFYACAFYITELGTLEVVRRATKPRDAAVANLTAVQVADIRACFGYYVRILRAKVHMLRKEVKAAQEALKVAHEAVIARYSIHSPAGESDAVEMPDPDKLAAIINAMRGLKGDRWVKPAAKVDGAQTLLLGFGE